MFDHTLDQILRSAALAASIGLTLAASADQPNIVLFFADDFGWVDVSGGRTNLGNGSAFYQTPAIDGLASEGLAFTAAYAQQNCAPTRASLLTGQYATRNNVYNVDRLNRANSPNQTLIVPPNVQDGDWITNEAVTIAETLRTAGYTTAHFGKFHVAENEADIRDFHGFDFNFGGGTTGAPGSYFASESSSVWTFHPRISPELDVHAGPYTAAYIAEELDPFTSGANTSSISDTRKHLTDATADAAESFIASQAGGDPFFMHLAFHAVHTPIQPRPDLNAKYQGIQSQDPRHNSNGYAALVEGMDQAIGRVLERLEDPNDDGNTDDSIADETIVILYSDNGGHIGPTSNTPLRGRKGQLFEGGIRVPMIVRQPDPTAPGAYLRGSHITDRPVHSVDFYRTLAAWGGATIPAPATHLVQGASFATELTPTPDAAAPVYYHFPGYLDNRLRPSSVIIHDSEVQTEAGPATKRMKLHYFYETQSFERYSLTDDLSETTNLLSAADPEMRRVASELRDDLVAWLIAEDAPLGTWRATGDPVQLPPVIEDQTGVSIRFGIDGLGQGIQGLQRVTFELDRLTFEATATGPGGVFANNTQGFGVLSSNESGNETVNRRIAGNNGESIRFTMSERATITGLEFGAISTNGSEAVRIGLVDGPNPFTGLTGYTGEFTLGPDSLEYRPAAGQATPLFVPLGQSGQSPLTVSRNTTLSLTAIDDVQGGVLWNRIDLGDIDECVLESDFDSDGTVTLADLIGVLDAIASQNASADFDGENPVDFLDLLAYLVLAAADETDPACL